jgi:Flp pilus assembly protein TadD
VHEAIACFRRALHVKHDAYELYYNLGVALLENGEPEQALRSFERGIALTEPDAKLFEQAAAASRAAGMVGDAVDFLQRALAIDPHRPGALIMQAEVLDALGDDAGALHALEALLFLPEVSLPIVLRSLHLCVRMSAIGHAQRILDRSLNELPDSEELLLVHAKILELGGKDDRALAVYRRLLTIDYDNPHVLACLGCLYERRGELASALRVLHAAYRLSPRDSRAEVNLAIVLEKLGRPDEAERHLRNVVARSGDNSAACNALGCVLANRGRYYESIRYFERAVALEPANERFRMNLDLAGRRLCESTVVS